MHIAHAAGTALPSCVNSAANALKVCRSLAAAGHGVAPHARRRQADTAAVFDAYGLERRFDLLLAPPVPCAASAAGRGIGRWMFPLKAFEHMTAGKPILASDIPALREILRHGETALLFPLGEPQTRVGAASGLLRDPGRAAAPGARAALLVDCTWDVRAARILAHLPRPGGAAVAA